MQSELNALMVEREYPHVEIERLLVAHARKDSVRYLSELAINTVHQGMGLVDHL